jgi:hypothetical protein
MATKDFILKAGEPAPEEMRSALEKLFSPTEWEKMTQRGARVRIITTSPWPKPPKVPKVKIVIDADYVARLKTLAADESSLEREVALLNGPQILQLGQLIGIPMAKKTKLTSLRAQLMNSLRSEIVWRGISGSSAPNGNP